MCTLAHVFEAAGLATVAISAIKDVSSRMHPPRVLHCEFPLGRPLGKPNDAAFQHDVLRRAFALLECNSGPVFEEYPEAIVGAEEAISCSLPPRFDPSLPPAVDEARGIRKAYDRARARRGVTSVGRVIDADGVPGALAVLREIADGADWTTVEIPGRNTIAVVHDIRTYYEEAALELVEGPDPGPRGAEAWFFEKTEAGKLLLAARQVIKGQGAKRPIWFYMATGHRS